MFKKASVEFTSLGRLTIEVEVAVQENSPQSVTEEAAIYAACMKAQRQGKGHPLAEFFIENEWARVITWEEPKPSHSLATCDCGGTKY